MTKSSLRSFRAWWCRRADGYSRALLVLGLNVPFLLLALARYLGGIEPSSITGAYALLTAVGYYSLASWIVITVIYGVTGFSPRLAIGLTATLLGAILFYLVIDGTVYRVYRFHIDAFWLQYLMGSFSGVGISGGMLGVGVAAIACIAALEWAAVRVAKRIRARHRWALGVCALAVACYAGSQVIHVLAYERNDARITQLTPRLPFYYPITSHRDAVRYAHVLPVLSETRATEEGDTRSLRYPLEDVVGRIPADGRRPNLLVVLLESWRFDTMNEQVSPQMYAFSRRATVFENHLSSGNSTPSGVFSIFYGIHPTYWAAVKANAALIDNPVLIDALQANHYSFGIFADSHFERHKIKDTMFRGIEVTEDFAGRTPDQKDADLTRRMIDFMNASQAARRPFFAFAFYKSTHFNYHYPPDHAPFTPSRKLNYASAALHENREAFFNDYRNAVHYTDELVGSVIAALDSSGALASTIVVITSDHGEEFDDNRADYWGHTGNFTGYQTRVPLIVYVPWKSPRVVTEPTAHVDIPPTLLTEGLGCTAPAASYSSGLDLFGPLPAARPFVVCSYINHAIVSGEDVFVIYPMYVQKYRLWDIGGEAGSLPPAAARSMMEEMSRFYRDESTAAR
jgi:membrane-anchored protein YejM (alkaline phosphatase superfamily)